MTSHTEQIRFIREIFEPFFSIELEICSCRRYSQVIINIFYLYRILKIDHLCIYKVKFHCNLFASIIVTFTT